MADESSVNGVEAVVEVQAAESFDDLESTTAKMSDLVRTVEALEREKVELAKANEVVKEKARKWEEEALGLRTEKEELVKKVREDAKTLSSIAGRAADLETEVSRLQHDLISTVSERDEGNMELYEVKKALEENKLSVEELKMEKELMRERIEEEKKAKAVAEAKLVEFESKIKGIREGAKIELAVKESEVSALKKKVAEFEAAVANGRSELQKEKAEKETLQEALKASEAKLIQLQSKAEEAEKVISELKENTAEAVNAVVDRDAVLVDEGSNKGTNLHWAVGAGATATATAAVMGGIMCLHLARKYNLK